MHHIKIYSFVNGTLLAKSYINYNIYNKQNTMLQILNNTEMKITFMIYIGI